MSLLERNIQIRKHSQLLDEARQAISRAGGRKQAAAGGHAVAEI